MATTASQGRLRLAAEIGTVAVAVAAVVVSIVSLVISANTATDVGDRDRTAAYYRDVLLPAESRFTAALDAFEQQERADLQKLTSDPAANARASITADRYSTLLGAIRSTKAHVDLTAPAQWSAGAAIANTRYGTERACMTRLIDGSAGANLLAEKHNRELALESLQRMREDLTAQARHDLATETRAPVLDDLHPAPSQSSPHC